MPKRFQYVVVTFVISTIRIGLILKQRYYIRDHDNQFVPTFLIDDFSHVLQQEWTKLPHHLIRHWDQCEQ